MSTLRRLALGAVGSLVVAGTVFAHHAWPVDRAKEVTVKGTVTAYTWSDPHVMIALDVAGARGAVEKWNVGGPSMTRMAGNGWDKGTLKPGDVITGIGHRFADGSNVLQLQKIVMADGKEMFLYGRPPSR
jgi:hypothetical protein